MDHRQFSKSASKVFIGVALIALAGVAAAADFGGAYLGLNAGWSSNNAGNGRALAGANCNTPATCQSQASTVSSLAEPKDSSFTGGAQAGYNWARGNTVFGLEVDMNYMDNGTKTSTGSFIPSGNATNPKIVTATEEATSNWVATIRPRIGFMATDKTLLYATGGLAFSYAPKRELTIFNTQNNFLQYSFSSPTSKLETGWVLGAGVEYAWSNNMSVRAEYQHISIGHQSTTPNAIISNSNNSAEGIGSTLVIDSKGTMDALRVGFNWKF